MEESNSNSSPNNNNIVQRVPAKRTCSKKKFMLVALILRAISVIGCIVQFAFKPTNTNDYKNYLGQYEDIGSEEDYSSKFAYELSLKAYQDILDLKAKEDENAIFNLIPSVISLVFEIFLFLHFQFEEKCSCGKSGHLPEFHMVFNIMLNCMLCTLNIVSSMIDYSYRRDTLFFIGREYQSRNNVGKAIDFIILFVVLSTYALFIIIGCFMHLENNMCNDGIMFCCCIIYVCDWCSCCCDHPPATVNSLNNLSSSRVQQQNALDVRKYKDPTQRNNYSNKEDNEDSGNNSNIQYDNKFPKAIQVSNSKDPIEKGKKKPTTRPKKKKK